MPGAASFGSVLDLAPSAIEVECPNERFAPRAAHQSRSLQHRSHALRPVNKGPKLLAREPQPEVLQQVYYAARDYQKASALLASDLLDAKNSAIYERFDRHYKEFLSASTYLASMVPPILKEEVLRIEDIWEEVNEGGFASGSSKAWFDTLDGIRDKILGSIRHNRIIYPSWKK
jgi:hypothetical protein